MKPLLTVALVFVTLGVLPNPGTAQEERRIQSDAVTPVQVCPLGFQQQSVNLTASAPAAATPYLPDFPTTSCSAGFEPNFGGTKYDRCFRQTFTWKVPGPECRCQSGELTIQYKAIQGGAINDGVAIFSGGSVVPGTSMPLYSGGAPIGQTMTKTIRLGCDMLKNNRLSFLLQDDTSVTSATLHVVYCCPSCPKGQVEETFPGTGLKYCCDNKPGAQHFCCTAKERPADGATNLPNGN